MTANDHGTKFRFWPARRAVWFVRGTLLLLLLVVVLLCAVLMSQQLRSAHAAARADALRGAHVVATQFDWMFQASAQALLRIDAAIGDDIGERDYLQRVMENEVGLPDGLVAAVYGPTGGLVTAQANGVADPDLAGSEVFKSLAAGAKTAVAPANRIASDGSRVFALARRLEREGQFIGIACVWISDSVFARLADTLPERAGKTVSIVGTDGMVIARWPSVAPMNLSGSESFKNLMSGEKGIYPSVSPVDGQERTVGFWRIDDWPLVAVSGVDMASVRAEFFDDLKKDLVYVIPILGMLGIIVAWLFCLLGRDDRQRSAVERANLRSDFLLKEIHHRVKNNLQAVLALIRMEDIPQTAKRALQGRIMAMVEAHQEMYATETHDAIPAQAYLERLIASVARGLGLDASIRTNIVDVQLTGEQALHLGLLTNELISNAFKHAFAGRRGGELLVELTRDAEGMMTLSVQDDGPGLSETAPKANMGSRLIDAFTVQLQGSVSTTSVNGLRTDVRFPLAVSRADMDDVYPL
jgi:two-component sensor histidine kinase/NADH:ubiquinone oxidoreductase subunit 6 (subunit J)